jgi:hypothetical protein
MVFGRITEAVSDLKETLRRLFQDPPSHAVQLGPLAIRPRGIAPLAAAPRLPAFQLSVNSVTAPLEVRAILTEAPVRFQGQLRAEAGWARWASGAKVCEMPVFGAGGQHRMEVPPLPRRPPSHRVEAETFRALSRSFREGFAPPRVRGGAPALPLSAVRDGLDVVLGLPIAIQGQDVQTLPKAQWMRYSLQLVKSTGENIRNLEVLGLYRLPSRGVADMRHDAKTGRLLVALNREATGVSRQPFLLARRRDDRTLVSCFLEEG